MTDERTVPQALLELRTLVEWRLGGQRAVAAREQPDQPLSAGHLSWMLARSLVAFERGDVAESARYQGHVEGVLSAMGLAVGLVAPGTSSTSQGPDELAEPGLLPPFTEQEQRVWAGAYSACLAHGAAQNVRIEARKVAAVAYEAVHALRRLPQGAAWRFPDGWQSSERCRAWMAGGVHCELPAGHEGAHECTSALGR